MSDRQSPPLNPEFTRQSETESVCVHCRGTVKTDRYAPLEKAESIHSDVCLHKPASPVRYVLD